MPQQNQIFESEEYDEKNKRTDRKHVTQIEIDENVQVNNLFKWATELRL